MSGFEIIFQCRMVVYFSVAYQVSPVIEFERLVPIGAEVYYFEAVESQEYVFLNPGNGGPAKRLGDACWVAISLEKLLLPDSVCARTCSCGSFWELSLWAT